MKSFAYFLLAGGGRSAEVISSGSGCARIKASGTRRAGAIILVLYGVIPTLQPANFGRVYAAYGGVFVVLSILWGWRIDKITPDRFDFIGDMAALAGVLIIMYWPRH